MNEFHIIPDTKEMYSMNLRKQVRRNACSVRGASGGISNMGSMLISQYVGPDGHATVQLRRDPMSPGYSRLRVSSLFKRTFSSAAASAGRLDMARARSEAVRSAALSAREPQKQVAMNHVQMKRNLKRAAASPPVNVSKHTETIALNAGTYQNALEYVSAALQKANLPVAAILIKFST